MLQLLISRFLLMARGCACEINHSLIMETITDRVGGSCKHERMPTVNLLLIQF